MNGARSIARAEADQVDARLRQIVADRRSSALELGALLCRVKERRLYKELGHLWFRDYVLALEVSQSYAERVMRAHRAAQREPALRALPVDKILFVAGVAARPDSPRTLEGWVDFAKKSDNVACREEKKRLTRSGVLISA